MLSVQRLVSATINPSGHREVNIQETSISIQRPEEELKKDRAQQKKQRKKQGQKQLYQKTATVKKKADSEKTITEAVYRTYQSEELIAPLAACRTIRTEAKSWSFENRFWLI